MLALSLLISLFCTTAGMSHMARASGLLRDWPIEAQLEREGPAVGWSIVTDVRPGGAAAAAGLRAGDHVRSEVFGVSPTSVIAPGVRLPLTVRRGNTSFATTMVFPEQPWPTGFGAFVLASQGLAGIVWAALGLVLVLMRGRRDRAAAMLGMVMQCLAWSAGGFGFLWAFAPIVVQVQFALSSVAAAGTCLFLPLAGLALAGGRRAPSEMRRTLSVSLLLATAVFAGQAAGLFVGALAGASLIGGILLAAILFLVCIVRHYAENDARARNRIKFVLLAFGAHLASFILFFVFIASNQSLDLWWAIAASAATGLAGPALIAYAMLRQRLFDLNFALNRTLVYGTVSFVLLAAFGLGKWVIEHLIPESWHAGSEYYSVGIALVLFLVLHRVHDWVERNVERFLFSPWHRNEEALRRFVTAAGHFEQTPALCHGFAEELRRFSRGAGAAIYGRDRSGGYRLQCGSLEDALDHYEGDDLALALMRAERRPVRLANTQSALPGVMALPMLDHGKLSGFALLGRKADGTDYRPDEVELLGWAAHQVGLDLQAMHAGELEAEIAGLSAQVAALAAQLSAARTRRKRPTAAGSPGS